jgi:hypothetical protein
MFNEKGDTKMAGLQKALEVKPGTVDGMKMILGAALVVLAGQMEVLNDLIVTLPQFSEQLSMVIGWLKTAVTIVEWLMSIAGNGLLSVGFIWKIIKFFKK